MIPYSLSLLLSKEYAPYMSTAKVTSKGQVTIPKDIRDRLGIKVGDEIDFVEERGVVTLRKHREPGSFHKWIGFLADAFEGKTTDEIIEELRGPPLEEELRGLPPVDDRE
jgi:AbrB family looped-hinge helix DNA binding protein